jgi:hypothetical protein
MQPLVDMCHVYSISIPYDQCYGELKLKAQSGYFMFRASKHSQLRNEIISTVLRSQNNGIRSSYITSRARIFTQDDASILIDQQYAV